MSKSLHSRRHVWLAQRIAEQRKLAGMTQMEVAAKMGRRQPFIANIESGQRRVDLVELLDLSAIIGLDVVTLFEEIRRLN